MNEEKISTLTDCLFSLVASLNAVLARLDILTDRQATLLQKDDEVFTKVRQEFFKRIIEFEVNKEIEKNRKNKERSVKFGSDIVR